MSKVAKTKENLLKCKCMKCPSYSFACKVKSMPSNIAALVSGFSKAEHLEGMFCAYEKSKCIEEEKGCICPQCKVYIENGLDKNYYCLANGGK